MLIIFRPDLIGNCCAVCRACRKGKPYITKAEAVLFNQTLTPKGANGETCEDTPTL